MKRMNGRMVAVSLVLAVGLAALGAVAAEKEQGVATPFNGKDLAGWKTRDDSKSFWTVGAAKMDEANPTQLVVSKEGRELVNAKEHGQDIWSEYTHGDAIITLEVMVPKGSNSGIYVHGEYEIQVLDSYGNEENPGGGDMGAVYGAQPPTKPLYKKPGEWSAYEIHWIAPKFDADGAKTANAKFAKVVLNGRVIHQDLEMKGPTPGGVDGKEKAKGPLMFQGNHGPVAYRNIKIKPLN
jgi:hypothetical protein